MQVVTTMAQKPNPPRKEGKTEKLEFMAEPSLCRAVEDAAQEAGLTVSAFLRIAAREKIKGDARRRAES